MLIMVIIINFKLFIVIFHFVISSFMNLWPCFSWVIFINPDKALQNELKRFPYNIVNQDSIPNVQIDFKGETAFIDCAIDYLAKQYIKKTEKVSSKNFKTISKLNHKAKKVKHAFSSLQQVNFNWN